LRLHEPRHQGVIKGRALPEVKQVWSTESAPRRRRAPERQPVHKCSKVGSILVYRAAGRLNALRQVPVAVHD
jgi:hypothetical protein